MRAAVMGLLAAAAVSASPAMARSPNELFEPAAVVPLASEEPAPKIVVDAPLPGPLAQGLVVIRYRVENLRIVPVFGPNALDVSPRIGHLHVTLDDLPWHWVDASGEPLVIQYLPSGPHKLLIELANANHKVLDRRVITFVIPSK